MSMNTFPSIFDYILSCDCKPSCSRFDFIVTGNHTGVKTSNPSTFSTNLKANRGLLLPRLIVEKNNNVTLLIISAVLISPPL